MSNLRIIWLGDIVARSGRDAVARQLPPLKKKYSADFVIANGENASGGLGLGSNQAVELLAYGIDLITLGDHAFEKADLFQDGQKLADKIVRPINFPEASPGKGYIECDVKGVKVGVGVALGRTFIQPVLDCPFAALERCIAESSAEIFLAEFHAEATSEKKAMGFFLNGRAQIVCSTHTHVQTADEVLLDKGTAYISDLGMCGVQESIIGLEVERGIKRFVTKMHVGYRPAEGAGSISGIMVDIDSQQKKATRISRIRNGEVAA